MRRGLYIMVIKTENHPAGKVEQSGSRTGRSDFENNIQESIAQVYIQILYAPESVKVNESTLQVSIAQRDADRNF